MAQILIKEIYHGDKYGLKEPVLKNRFEHGLGGEDLQTKNESLVVNCAMAAAEEIKKEGDFISEITDMKSPSFCAEEKV